MYLDRFDRYGFVLYFTPLQLPPGWNRAQPYDYTIDFDFVESNGLGVALWGLEQELDTGEGFARVPDWEWALRECQRRGIPVHVNTQLAPAMWVANRYRDQTFQKMPQYSGFFGAAGSYNYGVGAMSYSATTGLDAELGVLQDTVRRFAPSDNVVGWLEPHGELSGAPGSVLLAEFGPVVDATFRAFLQQRYPTPAALSQAWYGNTTSVTSWTDVHVPEVASFLGWGPDAVDVSGAWRVFYPGGSSPPSGWDQPGFDDSAWGSVTMPGDERVELLPRQSMLARRTVQVDAQWLARHPQVWLYLFDLNSTTSVPTSVNGQATDGLPSATILGTQHWGATDVTHLLVAGDNLIAMTLPQGFLGYRCYLSGEAPVQYPQLGAQRNTQWVDFQDWSRWTRQVAIRRGIEMIRQEDPERPINLMSPDTYADLLKKLAAQFGGHFHNTGYAAGLWADYHPLLSRSAGRPATAEPGNPAPDVATFRSWWGRWITEGLNGATYFSSQEDIMSKPDVLADFQANRAVYQSIGKYHVPTAEVAVLYGLRLNGNGNFPWTPDADVWVPGGFWRANVGAQLMPLCPRDGVTEADFADGTVDKYRVIVDSNTSFMDDALVDQIEAWIRAGGTFVTHIQSGRHTPTEANSWPISRLTGYEVLGIDPYNHNGSYTPLVSHAISVAPGQQLLADTGWLAGQRGGGLSLGAVASDVQDVLLWEDGSVAVGMRPLGNGRIIQVGWHLAGSNVTAFLGQVLDFLDVRRVPAQAANVVFRHFIGNSGLHDVWVLYNDSANTVSTDLLFTGANPPTALTELNSTATTPVTTVGGQPGVYGLSLGPWGMRLFLSPRTDVLESTVEWLTVQRDWWAGTTSPGTTTLPTPAQMRGNSVDFTTDWAFLPVDDLSATQIAALVLPGVDDSSWERRDLGIWSIPDHPGVQHAVLRRAVTIPGTWATGESELWLTIDRENQSFHDLGRVYVDGVLVQDFNGNAFAGRAANTLLPPGEHLIALEVKGTSPACGITANAWVYHTPVPDASQDLSGQWAVTSSDGVHTAAAVTLPGTFTGLTAGRDAVVDAARAGSAVMLSVGRPGAGVLGVLVNGSLMGDLYPATRAGDTLRVNVTNHIAFGATNHIELVSAVSTAPVSVTSVELRYYNPTVYP
jgi:hypothetical protein